MSITGRLRLRPEPGEWAPVLASAALFFCILSAYYVLRPVRDEMAVRAGPEALKWLFTATFVAMVAATPVFGWVAARVPRRALVPGVFLLFAANVAVFRLALLEAQTTPAVAAGFFVWVSVFNLFAVSVFWSLMADLFTLAQAERLYGPIAVGGSLGAIAGPAITASLVHSVGVPDLLLVSGGLLCGAAALGFVLARRPVMGTATTDAGLGGSAWEGLGTTLRSPVLRTFCAYLLLHSLIGTVLYFEQTRIVKAEMASPEARTAFFAQVDLVVNVLTVGIQLAGLAPLVQRFGLPLVLALLPAISLAGLAAFGLFPLLAVLVVFGVVRRAGEYAIARPAREMIFTVLPRTVKYKAKNFLDTTVFRGADALGSWCVEGARVLGLVGSSLALASLPAALAGIWIGWKLGRSATGDDPHAPPEPAPPLAPALGEPVAGPPRR